ncbi:MAG: CopG family transcriptional regulator [Candidatus Cloacimonas sp. 4484_143]|nr:MAG: CopG family transcriptional regulator [Candidatus Cloacimonas sp. 4484_143]
MATYTKRATVYFDPEIHRILKLKALDTNRSISDIVDEAIRLELAEDADDLQSIKERENEPTISYEELIADLKAHGKI